MSDAAPLPAVAPGGPPDAAPGTPGMPLLAARQLGFHYPGGPALFEALDFALHPGQIMAILGPNGCGKSTLLDVLLGILRPGAGQLMRSGQPGFVPQFFAPPFAYSVLDIVLMGRSPHIGAFSVPGEADRALALQALRDLQLEPLAGQPFHLLSGGQRQLALIARAIATECPVMLLDEPTSALDLHNQNQVLTLLRRLARQRGLGIIFTTHQPDHALAIADTTLLMRRPACLCGPSQQVLSVENLSALFRLDMLRQRVSFGAHQFDSIVPVYDTLLTPGA